MDAHTRIPTVLTDEGRQLLTERLHDIKDRRMVELQPHLIGPERDERDVALFETLLVEAADLEGLLAEADTLDLTEDPDEVCLGARVRISMPDGSSEWVRPVHPAEATVDSERISIDSPLARALGGAAAGDIVLVSAPTGDWKCRIEAIER
jgi:Transcription elongation factor